MVDKKPDFKVKWRGKKIESPPLSGNVRKIYCKDIIVKADENLIRRCMYFSSILDGPSDNILVCDTIEAAVMRKIIELLEIGKIECTWEELGKIARALKVLSVRPYNAKEGESHVKIDIVQNWPSTSRVREIIVEADELAIKSNRVLLAEMSGRFEEILEYDRSYLFHVPFVTRKDLRWIVDTIHLRGVTVSTWKESDSAFSEFEEYCYRLENFRIRKPSRLQYLQPSREQYLQPSSERTRTQSREQSSPQSREQPNFGVIMVDKKPDFEVKWHTRNTIRPPLSRNIRKLVCKDEIVEADENHIIGCMLYFSRLPPGTPQEPIMCNFNIKAAVMRKIIELLQNWEIQCTWEELKKVAYALKFLSVHPYHVAEGKSNVEIHIVQNCPTISRPNDIRVSVGAFKMRSSRERLVEMSGRFEELLEYERSELLDVPFVMFKDLRWIVDTIHQRGVTVSTWKELDSGFSEFEEYCYRLENFHIRQPSRQQYLQPTREQHGQPSREQHGQPSREQHGQPSREQYGKPSIEQYRKHSRKHYRQHSIEQYRQPSIEQYRQPSIEQYRQPSIEQYRQPSIEQYRQPSIEQYRQPPIEQYRQPSIEQYRQPSIEQYRQPSIEQYRQPSIEQHRQHSTKQYRQHSTKQYRQPSIEQYRQPSIEQYRQPSIEQYRQHSTKQYRQHSREQYGQQSREQYALPSREQYALPSIEHYRQPSIEHYRKPSKEQYRQHSTKQYGQHSTKQYGQHSREQYGQPSREQYGQHSREQYGQPSREQSKAQSRQQVSASIDLDPQEMRLPLIDECSTKPGTQKEAEPLSVKEELSAKSVDQARKSAGSSPKRVGPSSKIPGPSPKGACPSPRKG